MVRNILLTEAAVYVYEPSCKVQQFWANIFIVVAVPVANLLSQKTGSIKDTEMGAVVRFEEQLQALPKLWSTWLDLISATRQLMQKPSPRTSEHWNSSIIQAADNPGVDIVIHTASSMYIQQANNLIKALGHIDKLVEIKLT